ncbi:ABC transporter permease [Naasia sp. SYSU D00057]|uniref:ABC transporter permease n=1 Tax=Naasia sp. SYSU D00057 TaxID=2817380 RepID=UPI001B30EFE3|nr:ABC transporter permease subunit [Naasia sp. SYSU D00057]
MNLILDALAWIFSPDQYGPGGVPTLIGQHLFFTGLAFGIASAIAVPLGYLIGHTGRGREVAVALSGAARALPSFGLILLLVLLIGVLQIVPAVTVALVVLAIPSILAGAYAGLEAIDRRTIDAARAVGMTEWQILTKVEIPLGLPLLLSGMRAGVLQIVATATLAAYVGLGGLGLPILQGIQLRNYSQTLGGAILVVVLALLLDAVFGVLEQVAVPRGVREGRGATEARAASRPARAQALSGAAD